MNIEYTLLPYQRKRSKSLDIKIDVFPYASELWDELDHIGIINRMKKVPQLGVIDVPGRLRKSRYDYVILQLYFHQMIKKNLKDKLLFRYNNEISESEFQKHLFYEGRKRPSINDVLQLLTIIYNIGHFYNTFTASKAAMVAARDNLGFYFILKKAVDDERYKINLDKIIREEDYMHFHLINSLIILEQCNQNLFSVKLAKEIAYLYLASTNYLNLERDDKLGYIFKLFKRVREVSYMAYDLQISNQPIIIDLLNEQQMTLLFGELLAEYNDKTPMRQFVSSIRKLLGDTVYNEKYNAICYSLISKRINSKISSMDNIKALDYFADFFFDENSVFNIHYGKNKRYSESGILKVTFEAYERNKAMELFKKIEHTSGVCVGFYDREKGQRTILVSIKNNCKNCFDVAMRVFKLFINILRDIDGIEIYDKRYLLVTKFLLFYLFGKRKVKIQQTIDKEICVICTRGKKQRLEQLKKLLSNANGTKDQQHEVVHLKYCLMQDNINDVTVIIPASIIVYDVTSISIAEFDGLAVFPNRKNKNILFLEAKNMILSGQAKKSLKKKFDKLDISYEENNIHNHGHDVFMSYP